MWEFGGSLGYSPLPPLLGEVSSENSFQTLPRAYFLLAEGNYPFPSTYIPSAVGDGGTLPAWPMRALDGMTRWDDSPLLVIQTMQEDDPW